MGRAGSYGALVLCMAAVGCASEPDVRLPPGAAETDTLVQWQGVPTDLPTWQIGEIPLVSLGGSADPGPELFGRLDSAAFLSDGGLVVADGLNLEVRAFGPDGAHRWSAGGRGRGPGEFVQLARVDVLADGSVFASGGGAPANRFDSGGGFLRVMYPPSLADAPGPAQIQGATPGGRIVAFAPVEAPTSDGHWRGARGLFVLEESGEVVREVSGIWPFGDLFHVRAPNGEARVQRASPDVARRTQVAMGPDGFVVNVQDDFTLHLHDASGALVRRVEVIRPRRPVDADFRRRYVEGPLAGVDDPALRERIRASREEDFLPPHLPETRQVVVDSAGRIWVEEFAFPDEPHPGWWVLEPSGAFVARASLPRGPELRIHAIQEDRILLTRTGELGVPILEVLPLLK